MSEDKTRVSVDIYGMQYKLTGHSSSGHMRRVAGLVDEHMNNIAKGFPRLDTPRVAVLAAVNIADEYLKLKEQFENKSIGLQNNIAEEHRELSTRQEQLQHDYEQRLAELEEAQKREAELARQLERLHEEYAKLQSEYNEWIQLVQSNPSEPK